MMKIASFAVLALLPFASFAGKFCLDCGRNISMAKDSDRCAVCTVRGTYREFIDLTRSANECMVKAEQTADRCAVRTVRGTYREFIDLTRSENEFMVKAEQAAERLGNVPVWNFICYNPVFSVTLELENKEFSLNLSMVILKNRSGRFRATLKDATDTCVIGEEKGKLVKHRGIYVLDNLPVCLPGRRRMTLVVNRYALDSLEYVLIADDGTARDPRFIHGTIKSGQIVDFSNLR